MECLYTTTTKYTLEEYRKFNNTIMYKKYLIVAMLFAVLLIIIGGFILDSLFLVIFGIAYPIIFFLAKNIGVKKVFDSNTLIKNSDITFEFYEDCFEIKHEAGNEKIPYNKLSQIVETKTNYYLMIAKNQGYIIVKQNLPQEFGSFINSKKKA